MITIWHFEEHIGRTDALGSMRSKLTSCMWQILIHLEYFPLKANQTNMKLQHCKSVNPCFGTKQTICMCKNCPRHIFNMCSHISGIFIYFFHFQNNLIHTNLCFTLAFKAVRVKETLNTFHSHSEKLVMEIMFFMWRFIILRATKNLQAHQVFDWNKQDVWVQWSICLWHANVSWSLPDSSLSISLMGLFRERAKHVAKLCWKQLRVYLTAESLRITF